MDFFHLAEISLLNTTVVTLPQKKGNAQFFVKEK